MPVSPNFNIPYPDGSSGLTPLASWFAGIAVGVDSALMTGIGGAPRLASSDSERNAIFPTPAQGNSVLRLDKGWIEQYFAAFNGTTNPSGASPAGWYPVGGRTPGYIGNRSAWTTGTGAAAVAMFATGTTTSNITPDISLSAAGVFTFATVGDYEMNLNMQWAINSTTGQRNIAWDGTATNIGLGEQVQSGSSLSNVGHFNYSTFRITSPGQTVRPFLVQNSGANLTVRTSAVINYFAPPQ